MDNVNHPKHYSANGLECIDAMIGGFGKEETASFCKLNAFKYIWRCLHKQSCIEDVDKAIWYLKKFRELITDEQYGQLPSGSSE